jgi:hypothetical protein
MKRSSFFFTLLSFVLFVQMSPAEPVTSTSTDQQDVAVTIYNSNIGLVKDTRLIDPHPLPHRWRRTEHPGTEL